MEPTLCDSDAPSFPRLPTIFSATLSYNIDGSYCNVVYPQSSSLVWLDSSSSMERNGHSQLSLPFCRDIDTWQVSSTLKFKIFPQTIIVFPGLSTESTEYSPSAYVMLCQWHVKHVDVETQSYSMHHWFSFVWIRNYAPPYFREWLDTTHVWVVAIILQNSLILNNMEVGVLKAFKN